MKYTANVKWNGDHYFCGEKVTGSKIRIEDGKVFLYDDEESYIKGVGDFTRYAWVEVEESTLVISTV